MALQNEVAPPLVGDINKDTKIDGKSDENELDTTGDTEEGEDLEEGEILDSGAEGEEEDNNTSKEEPKESKAKSAASPSTTVTDSKDTAKGKKPDVVQETAGQLQKKTGDEKKEKERKRRRTADSSIPPEKKKKLKYVDHDQMSDDDPDDIQWQKAINQRNSNFGEGPIDYRKELAAYRGSSPEGSPSRSKRKRKDKSSSRPKRKSSSRLKGKRPVDTKGRRKKEKPKKKCKFFLDGNCTKGDNCPFLHWKPYRKKELCKYYLTGYCAKGNECSFMHDDFPCKFYHTGSKCYADKDCRFSHKPLTEETRKILDDYLKAYHGDDYDPRKRVVSPEPKRKRPCLLGSPPRGEETKRWQEEMRQLHKEQGSCFRIEISQSRSPPPQPLLQSPSKPMRPNFYMDTLQNSPQQNRPYQNNSYPMGPPQPLRPEEIPRFIEGIRKEFDEPEEEEEEEEEEENEEEEEEIMDQSTLDWKNICDLVNKFSAQEEAPEKEDIIPEDKIKQEMPNETDFAEDVEPVNNFEDCSPSHSEQKNSVQNYEETSCDAQNSLLQSTPLNDTSSAGSHLPASTAPTSGTQEAPIPEPIVIPSHLPRKQRELLLRIQKHQKSNAANAAEGAADFDEKLETESQSSITDNENEDKKVKPCEKEKDIWYSSEDDDDDDSDRPLTDVLKKIQQTPPPKITESAPAKPAFSITQMLSQIMQKANEGNRAAAVSNEQNAFWQNIFSGAVPPAKTKSSAHVPAVSTCSSSVSLPFKQESNSNIKTDNSQPQIRDPRLKSRDPRTSSSKLQTATTVPSTNPPVFPALETITASASSRIRDLSSVLPNQTSAVIVEGIKGNIPYKLYNITPKPLNYMPYIQASQSDPKLLNDPRLRKHMAQRAVNLHMNQQSIDKSLHDSSSSLSPKPCLPDLLFKKIKEEEISIFSPPSVQSGSNFSAISISKPDLQTQIKDEKIEIFPPPLQGNIFSTTIKSPPRIELPSLPELKLPLLQMPKNNDPRTRRFDQQKNLLDSSLPLQLTPETSWTPSVPTSAAAAVVPNAASHLPRAIADPRMAKLHHPVDPRRPRIAAASETTQRLSNVINKSLPVTEAIKSEQTSTIETDEKLANQQSPELQTKQTEIENTLVSKRRKSLNDTTDKKNTAVRRNRKSSMDYASPLNSCDDSNVSSNLNYNSYNQRPKKRNLSPQGEASTAVQDNKPPIIDISDLIFPNPDYSASDNSNLECDNLEINASLKDMFKTKDPTASPFC